MATRRQEKIQESPKKRRLSDIAASMQKEMPNNKPDMIAIMSAMSIVLAPFCKLYEAIKEDVKDNTAILASMISKLSHVESYIIVGENRATQEACKWETKIKTLEKKIEIMEALNKDQIEKRSCTKAKIQEMAAQSKTKGNPPSSPREKKKALTGEQIVKRTAQVSHHTPEEKRGVILSVRQTTEPSEIIDLGAGCAEEEKNNKPTERRTKESDARSPKTIEEFMVMSDLMNISTHEHKEETKQQSKETREGEIKRKGASQKTDKVDGNGVAENEQAPKVASDRQLANLDDPQQKKGPRVTLGNTRENPNNNSRTETHSNEKEESHEKARHDNKKEETRVFKLEQRVKDGRFLILNRPTVLNIMKKMKTLRKIRTEDLKLVEPYHREKRANAYLHLKSAGIVHIDQQGYEEIEHLGFHLTELTKKNDKNTLVREKAETQRAQTHYKSRTEELYRQNRWKEPQERVEARREHCNIRWEDARKSERNKKETEIQASSRSRLSRENRERPKEDSEDSPAKVKDRDLLRVRGDEQRRHEDKNRATSKTQRKVVEEQKAGPWKWLTQSWNKNLKKIATIWVPRRPRDKSKQ
ncbi:trichohyalin-like [Ambystoma mexicanum]|uniref:trichohyalin-like n=1 Tax=Ambystoma mexicanum TaxID=8296 RepID=UPI0037E7C3AD